MGKRRQVAFPARNGERGFMLLETLLALGILAAVGVAFLSAMTTSSMATRAEQEQITGEALAKSQMEFIKGQDYRVDMQYEVLPEQIPDGYLVDIMAEYMNPRGDGIHNDDGLQKITITIIHGGEAVFTMEGYKCFIGQ